MTTRVHVFLDLRGERLPVGALFAATGRQLTSTFSYSSQYLGRKTAYPIDPALPLRQAVGHIAGLPGAFADAAPDRWGRTLITRGARSTQKAPGRSRNGTCARHQFS